MIYVCADLHGMYDMFMKLIDEIKLSKEDTLYILGDIIDRGEDSYAIYQYVREHDNIKMIKGNHEQLMIDYVRRRYSDWFLNGGYKTMTSIPYHNNDELDEYLHEMTSYFESLPLYYKIEVEGRRYVLVHAGLDLDLPLEKQDEMTLLWVRDEFINDTRDYQEGTIIFGHTPNRTIPRLQGQNSDHIIFYNNKIAMDGGACFGGQINALRLDDLKAFTVK